ncbi:glycogen/starch/alpha-glucan phosphorylase [Blautia sp.]|uniref:Alpha-1,4 glucan phosphorylase n=1 Tax=Blautia glucerasea TaxID=536633 RepID=A0A6N2RHL2_9FIRM
MCVDIKKELTDFCGKDLSLASDQEIYYGLLKLIQKKAEEKVSVAKGRKLYYISAEFLIGKLLSNNLINLGLFDQVSSVLAEAGKSLRDIEEIEPEPSLGNGGLGRLAACFLDSLATLNLPGDGIGLRYHCGLFHQDFKNGLQNESPDFWIEPHSAAQATDTVFPVSLAGTTYQARLYTLPVTGYEGRTNTLNLFDLDTVDTSIIHKGISFDKKDIARNLTLFLYPDDSDDDGRLLRIYQQYLMVSAGAQLILKECEERGCDLHNLADYAAIQINDTHPSMVIPELIRLLEERGIAFEEAVQIVTDTCAYTNHTILSEALEKWPESFLEKVVPQLLPVIRSLDALARTRTDNEAVSIIDQNRLVHMAHMDIHFSHSTNGVATLHTEILKNSELHDFYELYPEKFNNKTNGITFRRWLMKCNPALTKEIESLIGHGFYKDATELKKLLAFTEDENVLTRFGEIKRRNKEALAQWLKKKQGISVRTDALFSIQSKRLHEYKRQQLNLLFLIHQYLEIKAGHKPSTPLVSIFGAKAAPAYIIAKDIIHSLLTLSKVIENDPDVSPWMQLVFVENYNVTAAEKMIPACDLSEQISLASKEASGTGNMKFMLNGALTLGTMDGANVEISQSVGNDNIYIFGQSSDQVIRRYAGNDYCAKDWYESDPNLKRAIDFLTGEEMQKYGQKDHLERLKNELIHKDWFQTLPDFNAYVVRKQQAMADYSCNPKNWVRRALINIAHAGFFSSDRTIEEYNRDIWHLGE